MERHSRERGRRWSLDDCLFSFLSVWTITQMGIIVAEFLGPICQCLRVTTPEYMPFAYFSLLALYVIRKEVRKRLREARRRRKGEIYPKIWWVLLFLLFLTQALTNGYLRVSMKAVETVLLVSLTYCSTEIHRYFLLKRLPYRG